MSAFFIAINRDNRPFSVDVANAMMSQLDRFGHDSCRLIVKDHYAIGFQSHWLVAEEQGERQPLQCSENQWFAFYGRLDNRPILLEKLGLPTHHVMSDAALSHDYLKSFGTQSLDDLIGPFVLIRFDAKSGELMLARDGMGGRSLSYQITENHVFAASNEMALAAHPAVGYKLNDQTVARQLANILPERPISTIAGLKVLYPGHVLLVNESGVESHRFYKPDPKRRVVFNSDDEYAVEFRRLLAQAVDRRMRCIGGIGSQLSGGLDSVPVTVLAANKTSENGSEISAYSWVFDHYPEIDERQYSSPLCNEYGIEQVLINCDSRWVDYDTKPLRELDPLGPICNPFMIYNHELFKHAQSNDVKVMLNGIHGDILYGYRHGILYELARAGDFKLLIAETKSLLRLSGSMVSFVKTYILKPLPTLSWFLAWRGRRRNIGDEMLQPKIVKLLLSTRDKPEYLVKESRHALRPMQWQTVLSDFAGNDAASGRFLESEYAIERRYPFRDRNLIEFMLAIPTRFLGFDGVKRPIVKQAFLPEFSAQMASRNVKANFSDVILNGIRLDTENSNWAYSGSKEWSYYVKECYFEAKASQNYLSEVVKWRCGYYDYWKSVCYHPMVNKLGFSDEASIK
jgi:asparagine synthase (glutamine-hydrolysing)